MVGGDTSSVELLLQAGAADPGGDARARAAKVAAEIRAMVVGFGPFPDG